MPDENQMLLEMTAEVERLERDNEALSLIHI